MSKLHGGPQVVTMFYPIARMVNFSPLTVLLATLVSYTQFNCQVTNSFVFVVLS